MSPAASPWSFPDWGDGSLAARAREVAGDVDGSLTLARQLEEVARSTGRDTWQVFSALATLGSVDLTTARSIEPHTDAAAILDQAGAPATAGATWGVYAAAPPGTCRPGALPDLALAPTSSPRSSSSPPSAAARRHSPPAARSCSAPGSTPRRTCRSTGCWCTNRPPPCRRRCVGPPYVDDDLRIEVWGDAASVARQEGRA